MFYGSHSLCFQKQIGEQERKRASERRKEIKRERASVGKLARDGWAGGGTLNIHLVRTAMHLLY